MSIHISQAFGRRASRYGRALPFSEAVDDPADLPPEWAGAAAQLLSQSPDDVRLMIRSPEFDSIALSTPENVLVITKQGWGLILSDGAGGFETRRGRLQDVAHIELSAILLGGQLRVDSLGETPELQIAFNMVSVDLFRAAAWLMLNLDATSATTTPTAESPAVSAAREAADFKWRAALDDYLPTGQQLQALCSWERNAAPRFTLPFLRREAAPSGVLAVTDDCLCLITDPPAGRERLGPGQSPHGKRVHDLPRRHAPQQLPGSTPAGQDLKLSWQIGQTRATRRWDCMLPQSAEAPIRKVLTQAS